jgi:hypothetical protein
MTSSTLSFLQQHPTITYQAISSAYDVTMTIAPLLLLFGGLLCTVHVTVIAHPEWNLRPTNEVVVSRPLRTKPETCSLGRFR